MKKKILILSAVFPPEPVVSASISEALADEFSRQGEQVVVVCPRPTRPLNFQFDAEFEPSAYRLVRLNSYTYPASGFLGRMRESYSFGTHCVAYIASHAHELKGIYANTWPLPAQLLSVRAARKHRVPIVLHIQDVYPEAILGKLPFFRSLIRAVLLPFDRYILKQATHVVTISEKMKSYLVNTRQLDASNVSVVCNWQDETVFMAGEQTEAQAERPFTLMYLGNIGPVAGLETVIEAFALTGLDDARLVIAGSGSMKEALKQQAANTPELAIEFWPVPDGQVAHTQAQGDVMLLPVKKGAALSSIPSKLPAYLFSSKPVIASVDEDSDTARAVEESGCGWVVAPESAVALSRVIRQAAAAIKVLLKEKGDRGFRYAMTHFSKKTNLPRLVQIIKNTFNQ